MRHRLILAIVFALALAVPTSAFAATESEPNDGIDKADGPLVAGANYDSTINSSGDYDWYVLYASGPGLLDVALTNVDDGEYCCVDMTLRDTDGYRLNSTSADPDTTEHLTYTTPGAGRYYVSVDDGSSPYPDRYRLNVTGPLTGGPTPAPGASTPNNNPDRTTAFGPLNGGALYEGRIDASGEEDWFYFYTAAAGAFDVELTNTWGVSWAGVDMTLYDRDGNYINDGGASGYSRDHINYTGAGPDAYYVQVDGYTEATYQLQITPASLLTSTAPPFLSTACQEAEAKVTKLKEKLGKAKERRRAATTRKAKQRASKKVKRLKTKVKNAKEVVKQVC